MISSRTYLHQHRKWNVLLFSLFMFIIQGCSQENNSRTIELLNIAVLPDQSEKQLRKKYQPLLDHLKLHAGLNSKLLIPKSYGELLQWFDNKQIDIALFGGVTYVKAHLQSNAKPLVLRDVGGLYRSVALVRVENSANDLQSFKGASLAFGSYLSTSGHFMPRHFFQQENIVAETFFKKVQYSGAHDITAEWVRDGKVDIGVANSGVVADMFLDGRLTKDKVKVIWESPPFYDYVWAIQPDISKQIVIRIRDAFIILNQYPEFRPLLTQLGANYYIPALHNDFARLEQVIQQMEQTKAGQ